MMKSKEAKIFRNSEKGSLVCVEYNTDKSYFDFIAEQKSAGLEQLIITSDIMIALIKMLVIEQEFELTSIEFMDEEEDLDSSIATLIDKVQQNNLFFAELLDKLRLLSDEQSIDILRIKLKRRKNCSSTSLKIQANGIFFTDDDSYNSMSTNLLELVHTSYCGR